MKRTFLGFLALTLTWIAGNAQAPHSYGHPLSVEPQIRFEYQGHWTDFYLPGKGVLTTDGVTVRRADAHRHHHGPARSYVMRQAPVHVTTTPAGTLISPWHDGRNLPLSPNGRLLSKDGFEVEFRIPNNPNDPGICATPSPEVVLGEDSRLMANCPLVVPCDDAVNRDANIPTATQALKFFQVNWVVIQNTTGGASSNITQARVDQLMGELNADFLPFRIQFCSDPATFVVDDVHYNLNAGTEDASLKTTYGITPNDVINAYVVGQISNPSAGGYARFPYDPFGGTNIRGGIVLARGNMFLGTHTVAHELGHTFGLHHTFRGVDEVPACTNCYEGRDLSTGASSTGDTEGDWCSDTNPHPTNSNICGDAGTDGCAPGLPWLNSPVNNHMSYSFCTTQFTPQQAGRMHCMIDTYLQSWVNFGGATCGALPPVADFIGTPTLWQAPMNVNFTDASVPASTITNWTWNFDVTGIGGVTPATFTGGPGVGDNPPPVEYTVCDTQYTVSLTVTNPNGSGTETKVAYITALCPASGCDTLDTQWNTPAPIPSVWAFGPGDFFTGIPAPSLQGGANTLPIGFYERYITPSPGTTTVGAVRAGLGNYVDPDSNTTMQVLIYNSDPTGQPAGPALGGLAGINPGTDLGVPGNGFFFEFWIPFDKVVIDSPSFLVGLEVFPGNTTDQLILIASDNGQGQGQGLNHFLSAGFGYQSYLGLTGFDFDLNLVPMLGPWQTEFFINGLGATVGCDTTLLLITDSALFHPCLTSVEVTSSYGGSLTDSTLAGVDSLFILYTQPGPDTISFRTVNECGRRDTITYFLTYPFDTTPGPIDFVFSPNNPICAGTAVSFTGTPTGSADYTWDFGDGTVNSSGGSNTTTHTYLTPGLYYVSLTVTDASGCNATETKLDLIEIIDCTVNPPIAGFDAQPDTGCVNAPFQFVDTSQAVPDAATNWFWAFDDGNFSLQQNPTHTYTAPGVYNVMLIASNSGGADTIFYQVEVIGLPCSLPIDVELRAYPVGNDIILNWETPADFSTSNFSVQRSYDGSNFQQIGLVPGTEGQNNLYDYIDVGPERNRTIYYRLMEITQNGETDYSNVVTARIGDDNSDWLLIYPNPVSGQQVLNIDAFLLSEDQLRYEMYDALGRSVFQADRSFGAGIGRLQIETSAIPQGTYFLRVLSEQGMTVKRIVVE
ncbi:MAG: PKD domain-containing protein [Bacteroidota bacterium]